MNIEEKRRIKEGGYEKKEIVDAFIQDLPEIDEFVIVCKYKGQNTHIGCHNSTENGLLLMGMLEAAKITLMNGEE